MPSHIFKKGGGNEVMLNTLLSSFWTKDPLLYMQKPINIEHPAQSIASSVSGGAPFLSVMMFRIVVWAGLGYLTVTSLYYIISYGLAKEPKKAADYKENLKKNFVMIFLFTSITWIMTFLVNLAMLIFGI